MNLWGAYQEKDDFFWLDLGNYDIL